MTDEKAVRETSKETKQEETSFDTLLKKFEESIKQIEANMNQKFEMMEKAMKKPELDDMEKKMDEAVSANDSSLITPQKQTPVDPEKYVRNLWEKHQEFESIHGVEKKYNMTDRRQNFNMHVILDIHANMRKGMSYDDAVNLMVKLHGDSIKRL